MVKMYAPALADIKVGRDEMILEAWVIDHIDPEPGMMFLSSYKRYLDDVIFRLHMKYEREFELIKKKMNEIDPNIVYIFEPGINFETRRPLPWCTHPPEWRLYFGDRYLCQGHWHIQLSAFPIQPPSPCCQKHSLFTGKAD